MHEKDYLRLLEKVLPVISMVAVVFSLFSRLTLPTVKPITVVLSIFFGILASAVVGQLMLHWKGLKTRDDQTAFLHSLAYGAFLFALMVGGMFARYFWELFQTGQGMDDVNIKLLLLPLLVSLMVFYPLWSLASGAPRNFFAVVAAFQNGFFWQTVFSGLKPFVNK